MNRKIHFPYLLFLYCLFATVSAFSEIKTIHNLDEISINEFSKNTLVMFDLDDVLIYPQDALLQNWRNEWKPEGMRAWTPEEDTIAWMNAKFQIMDPYGPTLLNILCENGVPTVGFTSFAMDQSDIVKSIPEWRSQHLHELGLNFKMEQEIIFPIQNGFVPPSFEKGVLYCGNFYKNDKDNKGKILSMYLDWLDWTPEQVVLVDDGKHHIESVKKELDKRGIPFLGFLYIPKELDPIDEKVAELQYENIINQKLWLSDKEAKRFLSIDYPINFNYDPSGMGDRGFFNPFSNLKQLLTPLQIVYKHFTFVPFCLCSCKVLIGCLESREVFNFAEASLL